MTPWYSDAEIDDLCEGLQNNAAKVRHLRSLGLTVTQKPNGKPIVMREHATAVLAGLKEVLSVDTHVPAAVTNRAALIAAFGRPRAAA